MSTHEVRRMLNEARDLNFAVYLAWGGEPLMRPDILDILECAHDLGLYTSIITNGTYLPRKVKKIAKVVDLTWVSLDHPSSYHDEMRGLKGTFSRAMDGIVKLRDEGGRVVINCVLSKLNPHVARGMSELAQSLGVNLAFDPMEVFPGINDSYALSPNERRSLFLEIRDLKKAGYPIANSYDFLQHLIEPKEYSCAQPRVFIKVGENGEVTPFWCSRTSCVLGDLRKQSLGEVLYSPSFEEFALSTEGCSVCNNSSTVEASVFYSKYWFFRNCFRIPSPILEFVTRYGL
jgi:MoaA/NifB/PqqE/SkfB family radical SAM enzyme